jgi:hypothetical protein
MNSVTELLLPFTGTFSYVIDVLSNNIIYLYGNTINQS